MFKDSSSENIFTKKDEKNGKIFGLYYKPIYLCIVKLNQGNIARVCSFLFRIWFMI